MTTRNDYISNQIAYLSLARRRGVEVRLRGGLPSGGVDPASVRRSLPTRAAAGGSDLGSDQLRPGSAGRAPRRTGGPPAFPISSTRARRSASSRSTSRGCAATTVGTARKFLRGPRGIGFLYVSDRALARGDSPLFLDMRGAAWRLPILTGSRTMPAASRTGSSPTPSCSAWARPLATPSTLVWRAEASRESARRVVAARP